MPSRRTTCSKLARMNGNTALSNVLFDALCQLSIFQFLIQKEPSQHFILFAACCLFWCQMNTAAFTKCNICRRRFKNIRNHIRQSDCRLRPDNFVITIPSQNNRSSIQLPPANDGRCGVGISELSKVSSTTLTTSTRSQLRCNQDLSGCSSSVKSGRDNYYKSPSQRSTASSLDDDSLDDSLGQEEINQHNLFLNSNDDHDNSYLLQMDLDPEDVVVVTESSQEVVLDNSVALQTCTAVADHRTTSTPSNNHIFPVPNIPSYAPVTNLAYNLFSPQDLSLLKIMHACDEVGVPRYFFDQLLTQIREEMVHNGFDPRKRCPVRNTLLRRLANQCPTPAPISIPVALENNSSMFQPIEYERGERDVVFVQVFDFEQQLLDLLSMNDVFGDIGNLDVNPDDVFGKFSRTDGRVDEVNSASWYQNAYHHMIVDPDNEFLMPIILYLDKTGTDILQRNGLEPVLFTTSVVNRKSRQRHQCWRPLGYIPDLQAKSSAVKAVDASSKKTAGRSTRHYHACLDVILQSLVKAQQTGIVMRLRLGNHLKTVRVKVPVAFVIGDAKSGDMLCGRYGNYNTSRISRACDAHSSNCSNTEVHCSYVKQQEIESLCQIALFQKGYDIKENKTYSKEEVDNAECRLHDLSCHPVRNAFHSVNFGNDPRGIYGATPTDLLHAFLEGILKYSMGIIFDSSLTARMKVEVDKIVDRCFANNRNSQRKFFPRTNFRKGFTNLTLLTACEWEGVCFTVMILSMMKNASFFVDAIESNLCTFADLMELLEALLTFHAWCKCRDSFRCSTQDDIDDIRHSIATLLDMVKSRFPRNVGNGWDLQKFHELLHVPDDIFRFGSPRNTDAGPGERSLKDFAKKPARTSQKREDGFLDQVSSRIHERSMFEKAKRLTDPGRLWGSTISTAADSDSELSDDNAIDGSTNRQINGQAVCEAPRVTSFTVGKPRFQVNFSPNGYLGTVSLSSWTTKGIVNLHPVIINWFIADQQKRKYTTNVAIWTEYKRNGVRFRAHPNYRSSGAWHDWAMIRWDTDDDSSTQSHSMSSADGGWYPSSDYLSKILCIFRDPVNQDLRILVHSCKRHDNNDEDSLLCQVWYLEYKRLVVEKRDDIENDTTSLQTGRNQRKRRLNASFDIAIPAVYDVTVDAIVDQVFVVQEHPGIHEFLSPTNLEITSRCIAIKKRQECWGQLFSDS